MVPIEECKGGQLRGVAVGDLDKLPHGGNRLEAERPRDINELDGAKTPSSSFVFGDERLWFIKARRDIGLRQAALLSQITQQLSELDLARRAQRVAHCGKPGSNLTASLNNPDLELSHFGILQRKSMAMRVG